MAEPPDDQGDPVQPGRHAIRDSHVDQPLSAMMEDYTAKVTAEIQQLGVRADAAPDIAAQVAEHTARLISKQAVTRSAWKLGVIIVAVLIIFILGILGLVWNKASQSLSQSTQVAATQAAYVAIYQRSQANVAEITKQIDGLNKQLVAQGKPPVPLPASPVDASAQLSYAKTELSLIPQVIQGPPGKQGKGGLPGQPPLSWVARNPDGSIETCQRAKPFDPNYPNYACSVTPK